MLAAGMALAFVFGPGTAAMDSDDQAALHALFHLLQPGVGAASCSSVSIG